MEPLDLDVFEANKAEDHFGSRLKKLAAKEEIPVTVVPLVTGDVRFVSYHAELVLIERKSTDSDLFTSMTSGRLVDQCRRLSYEADHPILLIDGPIYISKNYVGGRKYKTRLRYDSLLNQLLAIQIELGVKIIQIQNTYYSPRWVLDCYQYFMKPSHTSILNLRPAFVPTAVGKLSKADRTVAMLMQIPEVGYTKARLLQKIYGDMRSICEAPVEGLKAVAGIGDITAEAIRETLG